MKKFLIVLMAAVAVAACDNKPTLQKYFVDHAEKQDFATIDIAPGLINTDSIKVSAEEKQALHSLHKLNVLMFKAKPDNKKEFEGEKENVKALLKNGTYEELIRFGSGERGASVSTLGEGDNIDEFVVFVHEENSGFGVVRVLGEDMTPTNVMTLVGLMGKGGFDMEQLKPLQEMMKK